MLLSAFVFSAHPTPPEALLLFGGIAMAFGALIGTVPAFAVIALTNARFRPWRSVPILALGAAAGYVIAAMLPPVHRLLDTSSTSAGAIIVIAATIVGGVVAALFIRRPS